MPKPYSVDLRERVVMAVEDLGLSRRQAAAHFGVSYSSAILWVKRYRETGSLKPRRIGGYRPKKIVGAYRDWLLSRCLEADFTLNGLVGELAERGLEVDYRTVWNFVHAEDLVRQANWQKVGGASPPERRSNQTTFLREPCVGSREAKRRQRYGWAGLLSTEKAMVRGAEAFRSVEGNIAGIVLVRCRRTPRCQCTFARLLLGPWEVFKLPRLS